MTRLARPQTLLARVQAVWIQSVGPAVAAESEPLSEREGTVLVACSSAVWAQELDLLEVELRERLNKALGAAADAGVGSLRFRVRQPG